MLKKAEGKNILKSLYNTTLGIVSKKLISKKVDKIFDRKKYENILNSISEFQVQFNDTELDRKSFQDFLLDNNTRFKIYEFVYEKYSEETPIYTNIFISQFVTQAMNYMNEQNSKYKRPIFTNENLLYHYFEKLLSELKNNMFSDITPDVKVQLSAIDNLLKKRFAQLYYEREIQLSSEFLTYSLNRSIDNLGGRYTSDFNIQTQNRWSLECIGKSEAFFIELNKIREKTLESYSILCEIIESNNQYQSIEKLKKIASINNLQVLEYQLVESFDFSDFREKINDIYLPDVFWIEELDNEEKARLRYYIENARNEVSSLIEFLESSKIDLIQNPYLLITGKAGMGKSHLLADYANKFTERGHATFLFLGSYFYNQSEPSNQIMEWLHLSKSSFKSILGQLERRSIEAGLRSIIFIDALNEGIGKSFWKENLNGFIKEIQEYSHIGIVLSIRTDYEQLVIPDSLEQTLKFQKITHNGLEGKLNDSIKAFCNYYKIAYPVVPLFDEEYNNPLFLKMVCQLLVNTNQKRFSSNFSIEAIMNHYLTHLETIISAEDRMNFDPKRKVINEAVFVIAELKIRDEWRLLEYSVVYDRLTSLGSKLGVANSGNLLKELINEGFLNVIDIGDDKLRLDFQFEKFGDYFIASYIHQEYVVNRKVENFEEISELSSYFKDNLALSNNYGILIMLSALIANHGEDEICLFLSKSGNDYLIFESMFESLPYRNSKSISKRLLNFIENEVATIPDLMKYFISSQFQLSINLDSPVNAEWLHSFLSTKSQQEIDMIWTINISKPYRTFVSQFAKWYRESYEIKNIEEGKLAIFQLGWVLSSTNRYYRDQATLAIVKILILNPELIEFFFLSFVNVKDRYVVERIMAAVYGAIVNLDDFSIVKKVAKCVYSEFFDVDELFPHVLARDYGRQIINYALYSEVMTREEIELSKVFPAYSEVWKYDDVSDEQISELKRVYNQYPGFSQIVSSMTTDSGRAQGMYGDFGRYTFESTLSPWREKFDLQDLSNIAVKRCLELGYSPQLFSDFDNMDGRYFDRHSHKEERIGKKYQWIVFHEILAELSDNFIPYKVKVIYDDEYQEYLKKRYKLILETAKQNGNTDEEVLNKENHIVNVEKVFQEKWQVWDSSVRDIDVTVIDEKMPTTKQKLFKCSLPDYLNNEWILEKINTEELEYYLTTEINSESFYSLSFYHDERRKNKSKKNFLLGRDDNLTIMGKAIFVKNSQLEKFCEEEKNTIRSGSSPSSHNIFLREYYWSKSYDDWEKEITYDDERKISYTESSHEYSWEKVRQFTSLEEDQPNEGLSLLMPSKELVKFGDLKLNSEYQWEDSKKEVICFDGRTIEAERALIVKKFFIDDFCIKNDCTIVWICYYDKIGLQQYHDSHYFFVKNKNNYIYHEQDDQSGHYRH